jgi:hypothetical protein
VVGADGDHGVGGEPEALQHGVGLGHDVAPAVGPRVGRVGHHDPEAGRVQVRVQPQQPVVLDPAPGLGVQALLDRPQRAGRRPGGQVGQVEVVAGGGAEGATDHQPAAVA